MKQKSKPSAVKKWFLAIAIGIIFSMFIHYTVSTVFDEPQWNDFCEDKFVSYTTEAECLENNGKWNSFEPKQVAREGYCDINYECQTQFENKRDDFRDKAFIIHVLAGVIAIILGIVLVVEAVSTGFFIGGILELFFGVVEYWDRFGDYAKVFILGAVLAFLVWLGYKKLK